MVKILVVDDSELVQLKLTEVLSSHDFEVVVGDNGARGLELLGNDGNGIKLIICDVNMPGMDGITMCSKLHEAQAFKKLPIIMLTTETNIEMKEEGRRLGVDVWATKPINDNKLIVAVNKLIAMYADK